MSSGQTSQSSRSSRSRYSYIANRAARAGILAARRSGVKGPRMSRGSRTRIHEYTRTCGSGMTAGSNDGIWVNTQNATGLIFGGGAATGLYDVELSFSLYQVQAYIGGTAVGTYAMPSVTDFTNLYDLYRIDYIDVCITFSNNTSSINQPTTGLPIIYFVEDNDDVAATNTGSLMQYDKLKKFQFGMKNMIRTRIHPKPLEMVYQSAVSTSYQSGSGKKFLTTANNNIPHYGVKLTVDPGPYSAAAVQTGVIQMSFKYHITCKNTK